MYTVPADPSLIDSRYAAWRLLATLGLVALGNSGMYVVSVVLPSVQAEFGVGRGDASLPYTMMMVALGLGGLVTGRMADRFGIMRVLWVGALAVCGGYVLASTAGSVWAFALAHGLLLGLVGSSSTFAPLMADTALWWNKRRGIAVAICASGNYLAGSFWPQVVQWGIETWGWRQTYVYMGVFCGLGMLVLSMALRQRPPLVEAKGSTAGLSGGTDRPFGLSPLRAQMLSLMLACGIVSRLISGLICDRIGGLRTLLLGSVLQGTALLLFLPFDGMVSLYLVSALFGLFQGGIVPSYAIIVREHFKPQEAGARVGAVLMATMIGMALGGWLSGWVFDVTGSYRAAFLNGIAWNLLNMSIAVWLYRRSRKMAACAAANP